MIGSGAIRRGQGDRKGSGKSCRDSDAWRFRDPCGYGGEGVMEHRDWTT